MSVPEPSSEIQANKEESNLIQIIETIVAIRHPHFIVSILSYHHSIVRIINFNTTMNKLLLSCLYNPTQEYDDNSTESKLKINWNPGCLQRKQLRGVYDFHVTFAFW